MNTRRLALGSLFAILAFAGYVWGQPFVVPPQPITVANPGGTAAAQVTATAGGSLQVECSAGCGGGGAVTANQGTPAATANAWPIKVTDGVDTADVTAAGRLQVDGSGVTQPVSGTVTANQGGAPWTQRIQDGAGATLATVTAANAVKVDGSAVTQPVSGTVTTAPPANASTNVTQFGGNAVVTGTGASGLGIPRMTVSNDSTVILGAGAATIGALTANQSVNVAQIAGTATVTAGVAGLQAVGGNVAAGVAVAGNPVRIGASDGTNVQNLRSAATPPANSEQGLLTRPIPTPTTLHVTALSAANTAVTATLPAGGAGLFHYITAIRVHRGCTAAIVGNAVLAVTSTNLPGALAFSIGNACAVGSTNRDVNIDLPAAPLKSSVANTASTVVCPALGAAGICRINVFYYLGT